MNVSENDVFLKRARELAAKLTDEEKLGMITTHQLPAERVGIGEFYIGTEVARGYVGRSEDKPSTVFPQPVGLAATFDCELMYSLGRIAGEEARAYYNEEKRGGLALWGPTVDMVRDPRWGRTEEAYGEDVMLAGELTAAYTLGMAGENSEGFYKTVPTLKHFCANNNERDRGSFDAYLPPRLKYEYYYAAFENAIRYGGARSVMAAYNEINGLPAIMDTELETLLKAEWGLWFVVSDGGDFSQNVTAHHYCDTYSEAYELSLKAGCDIMTDVEPLVKKAAQKALADGRITMADIDKTVVNTLYARLRLGQFDKTEFDDIGREVIDCPAHREVNARAALEQMVLLKNDGLLPLKSGYGKIAVVGAMADESLMDWYTGYSTYRNSVLDGMRGRFGEVVHDSLWDIVSLKAPNGRYLCAHEDGSVRADSETPEDGALFELQDWGENWCVLFSVKYKRYVRLFDDNTIRLHRRTIYDWFTRETFNLREYCGRTIIEEFLDHRRLTSDDNGMLTVSEKRAVSEDMLWEIVTVSSGKDRAVKLARECDTVICCTGNYPVMTAKECYDRSTLALNVQAGMTQTLAAVNPRTVLMLVSSYPYAVCEESECAAAVLWSSHAGAELGRAAAAVISGDHSPAGRLPLTWYRSELDLPDIGCYDIASTGSTYMYFDGEPLYPFGHGLSYAKFAYGTPTLTQYEDGSLELSVEIENLSDIAADEVVQVYFRMDKSALSRPIKKLCGFERKHFEACEKAVVRINIPRHILRVYDVRAEKMIVEGGVYRFMVGASSADIRAEVTAEVGGESLSARGNSFPAESFDAAKGIRLTYSQKLRRCFVRCTAWSGELTYGGLETESPVTAVEVKGLSMNGVGSVSIKLGGSEAECELYPADSEDDFSVCRALFPEPVRADTLTVKIGSGCNISHITVIHK